MYNRALEEIEEQKNQINQQEHAIIEIKRAERKAIKDAYMANQELRNFREDVSFLTRETERLNEELRMLSSRKL